MFFLSSWNASAQTVKLKKAMEKYNQRYYTEAINLFNAELEKNDKLYTPLKYMANSYRKIKDYENAEYYYLLVINSDSVQAEDHLYYGQALKANGKLAAAKEQFAKFAELSNNDFLGKIMLQSIEEMNAWESEAKSYYSRSYSSLNTSASEYGLIEFAGKYYIISNREENHNSPESFNWDQTPFLSIYEIDTVDLLRDKAKFTIVKGQLNTLYHDGPLTVDEASNTAIITRVRNDFKGKDYINRMGLYEGNYEDGKWKDFSPLSFNNDEYSVGHAHLADAGKTLYFASDMPGGFGGMDLYISQKEGSSWGAPQNLGQAINTPSNEVFPSVYDSVLYYSSDGFPGYGGLDIYASEYKEGWQSPVNMRSPINSSRDDFGMFFITDTTGFYASNRFGGEGKDDIYRFRKSSAKYRLSVKGIFEYKGLPLADQKVKLLTQTDSILALATTDTAGRFEFRNLAYQQDLFFQVITSNDSVLDDARLFLANNEWEKIKLLRRWNKDKFKFQALPVEEIEAQEVLAMDQPDGVLNNLKFAGKIFKKLPGDFDDKVMVYLVDDAGNVVDSVLSGPFGEFKFEKLGLDEANDYFVKIDVDDDDINLALINETGRIYEVSETDEDGAFKVGGNVDPTIRIQLGENQGKTAIIARLEFQGKPLPYYRVEIYDADKKLVATVFTNEFGEFQYNKLEFDGTYFFALPEIDEDTLMQSLLYVIDKNGDPLYLIDQLKNGQFSFESLPYSDYEKLKLLEELRVPDMVNLKGQVFRKLQGDFTDTLKVYLVDESGSIVDSMYTDQYGTFNFEKLSPDESYSFKIKDATSLNLALLNEDDLIIEKAVLNEQGNFAYKKLTYQVAQFDRLPAMDLDAEGVETQEVFGQVFKKLPGDFEHGMEVYVFDSEGNVVDTAFTDETGRFHFKKLKADETYFFKIQNQEEDFQLLTLDEENNIIDKTIKNRLGLFKYKTLGMQHTEVYLEEASDHHQILHINDQVYDIDTFKVHYRFDSTLLNTVAINHLKTLVQIVKNTELKIEVESHTDTRGSSEYNERLSKKRTDNVIEFLIKKGIRKDRIVGNYYGELKPVVDCETKKCNNDDHFLNRRTEIKLSKMVSWR